MHFVICKKFTSPLGKTAEKMQELSTLEHKKRRKGGLKLSSQL